MSYDLEILAKIENGDYIRIAEQHCKLSLGRNPNP